MPAVTAPDAHPRRYLITGGTSGIGRICAAHLTAQGARVWITGTSARTVDAALADGVAAGGTPCDVTDQAQVDAAFAAATEQLGGLDGAFLNAGVDGQGEPAEALDPDHLARVLDVNVIGVLRCAQAAHRTLDRPGSIVVNTSVNALRPEAHFADYNASKAAALSLAQSLAVEWSADGLCVVAVAPGYFRSRMTEQYLDDPDTASALRARIPAGRFGEAGEIGAVVSFLLSGEAGYLTGACIPVAGASNV